MGNDKTRDKSNDKKGDKPKEKTRVKPKGKTGDKPKGKTRDKSKKLLEQSVSNKFRSHQNWVPDKLKLKEAEEEAHKLARVEGLEHKKVNDEDLEWAVGVLKRHFVRGSE